MTLAIDKRTSFKFSPLFKIGDFVSTEEPDSIDLDSGSYLCTSISYWYVHAYQISTTFFLDGSSCQSVKYLLEDRPPVLATTEIVDDLLVSSNNKYTPEAYIRKISLSEAKLKELSSKLYEKLNVPCLDSIYHNFCYELVVKEANLNLEQKQDFLNYLRGYRL